MPSRQFHERIEKVRRELGLLLCEVDGYGCKDMTHREETRAKWHSVEADLRRAKETLERISR